MYYPLGTISIKTNTAVMKKKYFLLFYHLTLHRNTYALFKARNTKKSYVYPESGYQKLVL